MKYVPGAFSALLLAALSIFLGAGEKGAAATIPPESVPFDRAFERECSFSLPFEFSMVQAHLLSDGSAQLFVSVRDKGRYRLFRFRGCGKPAEEITERVLSPDVVRIDALSSRPRGPGESNVAVAYEILRKKGEEWIPTYHLQEFDSRTLEKVGDPILIGALADQSGPAVQTVVPLTDQRWLIAALRVQDRKIHLLHVMRSNGEFEASFFPLPKKALECRDAGNPFGRIGYYVDSVVGPGGLVLAVHPYEPVARAFGVTGSDRGRRGAPIPGYVGPQTEDCNPSEWVRSFTRPLRILRITSEGNEFILTGSIQPKTSPQGRLEGQNEVLDILNSTYRRVAVTSVRQCMLMAGGGDTIVCGGVDATRPWEGYQLNLYRFSPRGLASARNDLQVDTDWNLPFPAPKPAPVDVARLSGAEAKSLAAGSAAGIVYSQKLEGCVGNLQDAARAVFGRLERDRQSKSGAVPLWLLLETHSMSKSALEEAEVIASTLSKDWGIPLKVRVTDDTALARRFETLR